MVEVTVPLAMWKALCDALDDIPGGMHADLEDAASNLDNYIDAALSALPAIRGAVKTKG